MIFCILLKIIYIFLIKNVLKFKNGFIFAPAELLKVWFSSLKILENDSAYLMIRITKPF